jgi:hypothetical protein
VGMPPPPVGGGPLDGPPPPSDGPTGPTPGPAGAPGSPVGGTPGGPGTDPQGARRAITVMGAEVDRALTGIAQAINQLGGQEGLRELAQARQLIEAGIAKFLAKGGQAPATSPVEAGAGFPGGGANTGRI